MNECVFSPCRTYRYVLTHRMDDLFCAHQTAAVWICLNPSTADEQVLDPTLRRIRGFTSKWGFAAFSIINLFAFRDSEPVNMKRAADPIGPENDEWILRVTADAGLIVAGWGRDGAFMGRADAVRKLLKGKLHFLRLNDDGSPQHPLYLPADLTPQPYDPPMVPSQKLPGTFVP